MLTEQRNPNTTHIDRASTLDIVRMINAEDQQVALVVEKALPQIAAAIDGIAERLQAGGRLFYVGAGTSGRLGVLDAAECPPTFSTSPDLVQALIAGGIEAMTTAIENAEDSMEHAARDLKVIAFGAQDALVGIAASGRTPYVIGALNYANQLGAFTVSLACNEPSPILEMSAVAIAVPVGPEVIAGSTRMKAGTAQKMVLNMLSTGTMIRLGKVYQNLMVDLRVTNQKLLNRAAHIVAEVTGKDLNTANALLAQSDQEVKVAIIMGLLAVSPQRARQLLQEHHDVLRFIIENDQEDENA